MKFLPPRLGMTVKVTEDWPVRIPCTLFNAKFMNALKVQRANASPAFPADEASVVLAAGTLLRVEAVNYRSGPFDLGDTVTLRLLRTGDQDYFSVAFAVLLDELATLEFDLHRPPVATAPDST